MKAIFRVIMFIQTNVLSLLIGFFASVVFGQFLKYSSMEEDKHRQKHGRPYSSYNNK